MKREQLFHLYSSSEQFISNFISGNTNRLMKQFILILNILLLFSLSISASDNNNSKLTEFQNRNSQLKGAFEENKGQVWNTKNKTAKNVKYHYRQGGTNIFMLSTGIAYQFNKIHYPEGYQHNKKSLAPEEKEKQEILREKIRIETYRMDMQLVGANPNPKIITEGKSKDYVQYYNRNALDVYSFKKLTYKEVYPGIDWVVYTTEKGLKYDFIVHPEANPNQIKMKFNHHEGLKLNEDGSFTLSNRMGTITEQAPVSFQEDKVVQTTFVLEDDIIQFNIENYNSKQILRIDPSVLWILNYGTSNIVKSFSCKADNNGNVYLTGETSSNVNISYLGYQNSFGGQVDAFIVKFNSLGVRIWASYYGGSAYDRGLSSAVDNLGNVYLVGGTASDSNIAINGHQNTFGGASSSGALTAGGDAFIVKFDSSGTRLWASYYGGNEDDHARYCSIGDNGSVYIVGETPSYYNISHNGHQNSFGGFVDAFIVKFDSSGTRLWASYYGGSDWDWGASCKVDNNGNVFVTGYTSSNTNISSNGYQNSRGGVKDAFLVKFNSNGTRLWGTYYGGTGDERGNSLAIDNGNIYLVGETSSDSNIAFGGYQNSYNAMHDGFIAKFSNSGTLLWASYYGGNGDDRFNSCETDNIGNIYITGNTNSNSNIAHMGYQNSLGGGYEDAFLVKFNNSGTRLWATYYGGSTWDTGESCSVNANGNVFITGNTISSNFSSKAFLLKFDCPTSSGIDHQIACNSFTWIDGNTYTSSNNTATHTLTNSTGCDSIVTLNLTIKNSSTSIDNHTVCDSLVWIDGNTYTSSNNTATYTLINTAGCDSIITLNLTVNKNFSTDTHVACNSYTWIDGNTYTSSNNTATHTLTNVAGCDSIITLNLTINNSSTGIDTQTACSSYTWMDGNTYTSSNNTATHTISNIAGCDSIVTLNLTINNNSSGIDTQSACNSYTWIDGNTYTSSNNTATHTIPNSAGCDSIITLNLTINNSSSGIDTQSACNSYTWIDGNTYTSSNNTATHTISNSAGCDSIITLNLTINNNSTGMDIQTACNSYTWIDGITYTSSNYSATHTLTSSTGCDSVVTLKLKIQSVSDTSVTKHGTILNANNSNATGYQWLDCNNNFSPINGETNSSFTATTNGSYAIEFTENSCKDTSRCVLVNSVGLPKLSLLDQVQLYPNPNNGTFVLNIGALQPSQVTCKLYDINGRLIQNFKRLHSYSNELKIDVSPGVYVLRLQTVEGIKNIELIIR